MKGPQLREQFGPTVSSQSLVEMEINIMSISQKHYQVGYALYIAHQSLESCQNDAQRRGWWAALDADAECVTPGYAQKVGW